ncbi:MAG: DUF2785 domain-containing protein [Nocardioidaceae bacterium]
MSIVEAGFWDQVVADRHRVPGDHSLTDLTAELTTMLGDPDPHKRDAIAYPTLATWVSDGVYDDLLEGLGDGMAAGLTVGLGERDTDTVFRRSFSALLLAECVSRVTEAQRLGADALLRWGDRAASWLVRERDLRGYVPGKGWAHAVAHGADLVGVLASSHLLGRLELTVLLDVVGDRLLVETEQRLIDGEPDRLALATMRLLRRDLVAVDVVEPWLARVTTAAGDVTGAGQSAMAHNAQSYLRALYLQLSLAPNPPASRADLLLALIPQLKRANPHYLG